MIYLLLDEDRSYKISIDPHGLDIISFREGNEEFARVLYEAISGLMESGVITSTSGIEHAFRFYGYPIEKFNKDFSIVSMENGRRVFVPTNVADILKSYNYGV